MIGLTDIKSYFRFSRYKTGLSELGLEDEFKNELHYINLSRVRIIDAFLVFLVLIQLYTDFFIEGLWSKTQQSYFKIFDLILGILVVTIFVIVNFFHSNISKKPRFIHRISYHIFVLSILIWSALVSIIESASGEIGFTFMITVFSVCILFILRHIYLLIYFVISYIVFIIGIDLFGSDNLSYNSKIFAVTVQVGAAWIISRALYYTRVKNFVANKKLEIARNTLDLKVKERTQEISEKNIQLKKEITERKKYEKNLEEEKKNAQEADKLKSIFLANMSHEIRTPLNGIMGFSELLGNLKLSQEKKKKYISIIKRNGQQLLKIIDDILDISMIESNQLRVNLIEYNLNSVYNDTLIFFENYKKSIDKDHIELRSDNKNKTDQTKIITDPSRLHQVINNIMKNAFKFTHKGYVSFYYTIQNNNVIFSIEDTGIGIDKNKLEFIFDRFRQGEESLNRSFTGTGLGLSISKGIAEKLGGKIWIDELYTQGSKFCFSFPISPNKPWRKKTKTNVQNKHDFEIIKNKKILIVEDDDSSYSYLVEVLHPYKPDITRANNGIKTLQLFEKERKFDIILLDIHLPEMDGYETTEKIRQIDKKIPIIVQTANAMNDDKTKALQKGCTDYISKPVDSKTLLKKVSQYLS